MAHLESENNLSFDLSVKTTVLTCFLEVLRRCINHFNFFLFPSLKKNEVEKTRRKRHTV